MPSLGTCSHLPKTFHSQQACFVCDGMPRAWIRCTRTLVHGACSLVPENLVLKILASSCPNPCRATGGILNCWRSKKCSSTLRRLALCTSTVRCCQLLHGYVQFQTCCLAHTYPLERKEHSLNSESSADRLQLHRKELVGVEAQRAVNLLCVFSQFASKTEQLCVRMKWSSESNSLSLFGASLVLLFVSCFHCLSAHVPFVCCVVMRYRHAARLSH